jgi:DHA1 family multidrug resistance protein-like MFS transporter
MLSAYSIPVYGWRWSQWEILWLGGPTFLLLLCALPETSSATILLRRAQRLRKLTGNYKIRSQSELDQAQMTAREITFNALIKPWEINILDPAVLYTTLYTGLVYGIFYTYFEAFPMVYQEIYGFGNGALSLTYLAVAAAQVATPAAYMTYFRLVIQRKMEKHGIGQIENFLVAGLIAGWLLPAGLLIFG